MKRFIRTRVFIIWSSHKGGKWLEEICFSKECAEQSAKIMRETYPELNFRIEEKATRDTLIWEA